VREREREREREERVSDIDGGPRHIILHALSLFTNLFSFFLTSALTLHTRTTPSHSHEGLGPRAEPPGCSSHSLSLLDAMATALLLLAPERSYHTARTPV